MGEKRDQETESRPAGRVMTLPKAGVSPNGHEAATHARIAADLARLKGHTFAGQWHEKPAGAGRIYLVPSDTLIRGSTAEPFQIEGEHDLFGGVVPAPFVGTKAISHPRVDADAAAPEGWADAFAAAVQEAVCRGYTAFSVRDARRAAVAMLDVGPVRFKPVLANAGKGQAVLTSLADLDTALEAVEPGKLAVFGVVLEENLTDVETLSVGQVRVADLIASYWGRQSFTSDNLGERTYGGSDLFVVRGGYEALLGLELPGPVAKAVAQAHAYDVAAARFYPGLIASRRNYDVAQGRDARGEWRSGVLEQSWRIGGASTAEAAALNAFRNDPSLTAVRARSVEVYGDAEPPSGAVPYVRMEDPDVGLILKYAIVERV